MENCFWISYLYIICILDLSVCYFMVDDFVSTSSPSLIILLPSTTMQYVNFAKNHCLLISKNWQWAAFRWNVDSICYYCMHLGQTAATASRMSTRTKIYIYIDSIVSSALIWLSLDEVKFFSFFPILPFCSVAVRLSVLCIFYEFHEISQADQKGSVWIKTIGRQQQSWACVCRREKKKRIWLSCQWMCAGFVLELKKKKQQHMHSWIVNVARIRLKHWLISRLCMKCYYFFVSDFIVILITISSVLS